MNLRLLSGLICSQGRRAYGEKQSVYDVFRKRQLENTDGEASLKDQNVKGE
jgi:hypothetical protein